jgi:hypothetical protein
MSHPVWTLMALDARAIARRRWLLVALVLGALVAVAIALFVAGREGAALDDAFRRNAVSLLFLGGLAVSTGLGGPALNSDAHSGAFALLAGSGVSKADLVWARLPVRVAGLAIVILTWGAVLQLASLVVGRGLDGPLAVHTLLVLVSMALVLLSAAAAGTLVGPIAAGVFGALVYVNAEAVVNLKAADDQGLLGGFGAAVQAAYFTVPRGLPSEMVEDLRSRGVGGPAAAQFEINQNVVQIPPAGLSSVLWTLAWCGLFVVAALYGFRRREL